MKMSYIDYSKWNKVLWEHFFSTKEANPVLYIDNDLLDGLGKKNGLLKLVFPYFLRKLYENLM